MLYVSVLDVDLCYVMIVYLIVDFELLCKNFGIE